MDAFDWINQLSENQTVGYADRYCNEDMGQSIDTFVTNYCLKVA